MEGDYSAQADQIVNQVAVSVANWSTAMAVESIKWLLHTLGQSTEPDLGAIVPVYDRMLAISLLLLGGIVALALVERIAWGSLGTGLAIVPRVVAATFFAYSGLELVKYVAGYAALLATAWSADFSKLSDTLLRGVAVSEVAAHGAATGAHVSTFGLIRHRALSLQPHGPGSRRARSALGAHPHSYRLRAAGQRDLDLATDGEGGPHAFGIPDWPSALQVRRRYRRLCRLSLGRHRSHLAD